MQTPCSIFCTAALWLNTVSSGRAQVEGAHGVRGEPLLSGFGVPLQVCGALSPSSSHPDLTLQALYRPHAQSCPGKPGEAAGWGRS